MTQDSTQFYSSAATQDLYLERGWFMTPYKVGGTLRGGPCPRLSTSPPMQEALSDCSLGLGAVCDTVTQPGQLACYLKHTAPGMGNT